MAVASVVNPTKTLADLGVTKSATTGGQVAAPKATPINMADPQQAAWANSAYDQAYGSQPGYTGVNGADPNYTGFIKTLTQEQYQQAVAQRGGRPFATSPNSGGSFFSQLVGQGGPLSPANPASDVTKTQVASLKDPDLIKAAAIIGAAGVGAAGLAGAAGAGAAGGAAGGAVAPAAAGGSGLTLGAAGQTGLTLGSAGAAGFAPAAATAGFTSGLSPTLIAALGGTVGTGLIAPEVAAAAGGQTGLTPGAGGQTGLTPGSTGAQGLTQPGAVTGTAGAGAGGAAVAPGVEAALPVQNVVTPPSAGLTAPGAASEVGTGLVSSPAAAGTVAAGTGAAAAGGAGAGTTAGTVASGLGAASTLGGLASTVGGLGQIAGGVAAGNALLGDPLGLNKGADAAAAAAANASNTSAQAQAQLAQIAQDQWNYYKQNYQPLETNLIHQAMTAGSPDEFARARGAATADVTGAYDQARKQATARLQSYGINPGSPAYQATLGSTDLAEGASRAGALTTADNMTRNLAYSKGLDVAGLGRNIPAQSAASTANAANAANSAGYVANQTQIAQNAQSVANTKALGAGVQGLGSLASQWFGTPTAPTTTTTEPTFDSGFRFAKGGKVFTPHMKHYADGGGVGRQGLDTVGGQDMSNMGQSINGPGTGTSDSIPAQVDGQEPAALSSGEFVLNADAMKLTGEQIAEAINKAGLELRSRKTSADVPADAGAQAYARGGRVKRYGLGNAYV